MFNREVTIKEVQERQRKLVPHPNKGYIYNAPFIKMSEILPSLWRQETLMTGVQEQIEALVGVCVVHLADYCNAKGLDLGEIVDMTLSRLEKLQEKKDQSRS